MRGSTVAQTHDMAAKRKRRDMEGTRSSRVYFAFMDEDDRHEITAPVPKEDTNHPSDAKLKSHEVLHPELAHLEDVPAVTSQKP